MTTTDLEVGGAHDGTSDEHAPYRYYYAVALSYVCMYAATDPSHIPPLERQRQVGSGTSGAGHGDSKRPTARLIFAAEPKGQP